MSEEKVSKKKQKAMAFRKTKEERDAEKAEKAEKAKQAEEAKQAEAAKQAELQTDKKRANDDSAENGDEPAKKKRKTRRGKKGKGVNGGKGPRFILFVGNLPYDVKQEELATHFKNALPDRIRIRKEKGIAFLEFDSDNKEIQSKMDHALAMHHLVFRKRKINVELTVGGGGNSEARTQKLKDKNDKLEEERKEKAAKEAKKAAKKAAKEPKEAPVGGMHPARAALLNQ